MTVDDAINFLMRIQAEGKGAYPLQLMEVDAGVTFARDVTIIDAQECDGERVWIYPTTRHSPEWFKNV